MGIAEDMADAFTKPFKPLIEGGEKMVEFFKKLPSYFDEVGRRFRLIKTGFDDIFGGIGDEFIGLGAGLELGVSDISKLLEFVFLFVGSYLSCGIYFLTNLKGCLVYYLVESLGQIIYLPVRLIVWFLLIFKIKLQPIVDKIWIGLEKIDKFCYKFAKFHIIHYPHNIRQRCYVCKRLRMDTRDGSYKSVITRQSADVNYDFSAGGGIAQKFQEGTNRINKGADELKSAFTT